MQWQEVYQQASAKTQGEIKNLFTLLSKMHDLHKDQKFVLHLENHQYSTWFEFLKLLEKDQIIFVSSKQNFDYYQMREKTPLRELFSEDQHSFDPLPHDVWTICLSHDFTVTSKPIIGDKTATFFYKKSLKELGFEGKTYRVNSGSPMSYALELLEKKQKQGLNYILLSDLVESSGVSEAKITKSFDNFQRNISNNLLNDSNKGLKISKRHGERIIFPHIDFLN